MDSLLAGPAASSNPFEIILPELWQLIRDETETFDDATTRVQLQRTCRAAHALDPGLILADMWDDLIQQREDRKQHVLDMLKEVDAARLFEQPWFEFTFEGEFSDNDPTDMEGLLSDEWSIDFRWDLPCNSWFYLMYQPEHPLIRWTIQMETRASNAIGVALSTSTLVELLTMCPILCFGASEHVMNTHIMDDDLISLFVRKAYRRKNLISH